MTGGDSLDPRIERSRRVIGEAALDVLAEDGYGALTIEGVAKRAGVGKATIYRHWSSKLDLVGDAIAGLKPPLMTVDPDAPVGDQVRTFLRSLRDVLVESRWAAVLPAIIDAAARHEEVADWHRGFSRARRQPLVAIVERAAANGEIADVDADLLADQLVGPLFLRQLMLHDPIDDASIDALVDQALGSVMLTA